MNGIEDTAGFDLITGFELSGLSLTDVQMLSRAITVSVPWEQMVLAPTAPEALSDLHHDVIVQVLNEHFLGLGLGFPVAYRVPLDQAAESSAE